MASKGCHWLKPCSDACITSQGPYTTEQCSSRHEQPLLPALFLNQRSIHQKLPKYNLRL